MTTTTPQVPTNPRPSPTSEQRFLIDTPALAEQLSVTQRFIRRLIAEDRVPYLKIGKFIRFDPAEIENWLDDQRVQPFQQAS